MKLICRSGLLVVSVLVSAGCATSSGDGATETSGNQTSGTAGGAGGEGGAGTGGEAGFPEGCFAGQRQCDPRTAEGCDPGYACDLGVETSGFILTCYEPPNDAALGASCDNHGGPFCQPGLGCGPTATCRPFCCSDAECTAFGEECVVLSDELGTLGLCLDPATIPECAPAGAFCSEDGDCCSEDCHAGHCH